MLDSTTALRPEPAVVTSAQAETALWSATAFARWLEAAPAGATAIYHRGHLVADRALGLVLSEHRRVRLARLADVAFDVAGAGQVHLVQRRHPDGGFAYLAIKASPPPRAAHQLVGAR